MSNFLWEFDGYMYVCTIFCLVIFINKYLYILGKFYTLKFKNTPQLYVNNNFNVHYELLILII
jgi:hypothetical protein